MSTGTASAESESTLQPLILDGSASSDPKPVDRPRASAGEPLIIGPDLADAGPAIVGGAGPAPSGPTPEPANFERASEAPRRRGRPAGSRNGEGGAKRTGKPTLDLSGVEMMLLSVHSVLAGVVHQPLLEISQKEASELTKGIANVQAHYPITVDPKIQAWFGLGMVAAAIYGPRLYMMRAGAGPKTSEPQKPKPEPERPRTPADVRPKPNAPMTPSQMFGPGFSNG